MKFGLIQENYIHDKHAEWKMLVCCILLNQTQRTQVDQVIWKLFIEWPTPQEMSEADPLKLEMIITPLGFYKKRTHYLIGMSREYVECKALEKTKAAKLRGFEFDPRMLPGCGEYAFHSWMIFTKHVDTFGAWIELFGNPVPVEDKDLLAYLKWRSRYDPRNRTARNPRDI